MERTQVYLDMTGPAVQPWIIEDVSPNRNSNYTSSVFQIINDYTGKALTVEPGNDSDRSIKQMTAWQLACEEWTFVPATTPNYYYIVNRRNGLILEIGGGNTDNGASLNLWENYQHAWQEWAFLDVNNPNGTSYLTPSQFTDGHPVHIYSRHAGKVIEIRDGQGYDGAPANTWVRAGGGWQKWHLQFSGANRPAAPGAALATTNAKTAADVTLYPNPATDKLSITLPSTWNATSTSVRLTDIQGRAVKTEYHEGQVDISSLANGLYFVIVTDGTQTARQKFTKL